MFKVAYAKSWKSPKLKRYARYENDIDKEQKIHTYCGKTLIENLEWLSIKNEVVKPHKQNKGWQCLVNFTQMSRSLVKIPQTWTFGWKCQFIANHTNKIGKCYFLALNDDFLQPSSLIISSDWFQMFYGIV